MLGFTACRAGSVTRVQAVAVSFGTASVCCGGPVVTNAVVFGEGCNVCGSVCQCTLPRTRRLLVLFFNRPASSHSCSGGCVVLPGQPGEVWGYLSQFQWRLRCRVVCLHAVVWPPSLLARCTLSPQILSLAPRAGDCSGSEHARAFGASRGGCVGPGWQFLR